MIERKKIDGFTLVETIFTLAIGSALSIGIFIVFLSSINQVNKDGVLNDLQGYVSLSMQIISEKIRNADQIVITNSLGSSTINISQADDGGSNQNYIYTIENNMIYENSRPMKLYGYRWLEEQDLYDISIQLKCANNNLSFFDTDEVDLNNNIYDLDIIINIESNTDDSYQRTYETSNRIFAINKYSQIQI